MGKRRHADKRKREMTRASRSMREDKSWQKGDKSRQEQARGDTRRQEEKREDQSRPKETRATSGSLPVHVTVLCKQVRGAAQFPVQKIIRGDKSRQDQTRGENC